MSILFLIFFANSFWPRRMRRRITRNCTEICHGIGCKIPWFCNPRCAQCRETVRQARRHSLGACVANTSAIRTQARAHGVTLPYLKGRAVTVLLSARQPIRGGLQAWALPKTTQPGSVDPGCAMNYQFPAAIKDEEAETDEVVAAV